MADPAPIKRNESLKNLSRDHHYGLLLCWKIRTSIKTVDLQRIKAYCDYFFAEHLLPHFNLEERHVFPLLGEENSYVQAALADHRHLKSLFDDTTNIPDSLLQIEIELEKHIRFEERVLFKELQAVVPEDLLTAALSKHDATPTEDTWPDKFWERKTNVD